MRPYTIVPFIKCRVAAICVQSPPSCIGLRSTRRYHFASIPTRERLACALQTIQCSDSGPWYEQGRQCLFSLYTDMRLCPLKPRRQSCRLATTCNSLNSGGPIFLPWLPLRATPRESPATRFALPGVVSHLQADHVLQGEGRRLQACEPTALRSLTNQAYVPLSSCNSSRWLVSFCISSSSFPSPGYLFSKFNRARERGPGGREVACSRGLTGSLVIVRVHA